MAEILDRDLIIVVIETVIAGTCTTASDPTFFKDEMMGQQFPEVVDHRS